MCPLAKHTQKNFFSDLVECLCYQGAVFSFCATTSGLQDVMCFHAMKAVYMMVLDLACPLITHIESTDR